MLKECVTVFQNMGNGDVDRLVIDNYVPSDGTYCLVEIQGDSFIKKDIVDIGFNKKTNELEGVGNKNYPFIRTLDYYSKLISMQKPMELTKKIHSNNYLSFAIKKNTLDNDTLWDKSIDTYYDTLANPYKKYSKASAKTIYEHVEEELGTVDVKLLEKIRHWIKTGEFQEGIDPTKKDYLKIFFIFEDKQATLDLFKKEGNRYLLPNIYNSNDFNVMVEDQLLGLPNNNMGMNSKKPYLANKTRKSSVPYLVTQKEALVQTKFFDFLMELASKGQTNVYVDFDGNKIRGIAYGEARDFSIESGYFLRVKKGKVLEVLEGDTISGYYPDLKKAFQMKNHMCIPASQMKQYENDYGRIGKLSELEILFNDILFNKKLMYNYFTKPEDIDKIDGPLLNVLLTSRERLFAWFYKNQNGQIADLLDNITYKIIERSIATGNFYRARHQFNLRWSILNYFSGERMTENMEDVRDTLRTHINEKAEWQFTSDQEYYYAIGQFTYYLISKSNAKNKPVSLAQPILNAKSNELIVQRVGRLFEKYAHAIGLEAKYKRSNNLFDHIVRYTPVNNTINKEMMMAGLVASNLIYEIKEENK